MKLTLMPNGSRIVEGTPAELREFDAAQVGSGSACFGTANWKFVPAPSPPPNATACAPTSRWLGPWETWGRG